MRQLFPLFMMLMGILCGMVSKSAAQTCATPTAIQFTTSPAVCFGAGTVTVTTVNGAAAPDDSSMRYQLIYDSVGSANNLQVVKGWQANPSFTQVAGGLYFINVQKICGAESGGVSAIYQSPAVTVGGINSPVSISALTRGNDSVTCSSGGKGLSRSYSFSVTAAGGGGGYRYALIVSQNETEPISDYIVAPQTSNTFSNLAAGTYYVRVYDNCGYYATAPIVISTGSTTDNTYMSTNFRSIYSCDSIQMYWNLYNYSRTAVGAPYPGEKLWYQIGANGVADTVTGWSYTSTSTSTAYNYNYPTFKFADYGYPDTVYFYYKNACGNIFTTSRIIQQPRIGIQFRSLGSSSCDNSIIQVSLVDSANGGSYGYYNGKLSLDSGKTWSPVNHNGYTFSDTLYAGQTYYVWATGSCGDTVKRIFQIPVPYITLDLKEANAFACPGNSGFYMEVTNYSGPAKRILFTVLQQPAGANLPTTFYDSLYHSSSTPTGIPYIDNYQYTYNLPLGTYIIQAQDSCGSIAKDTIVLNTPMVQTFAITLTPGCSLPANNGFTLTSNVRNSLGVNNSSAPWYDYNHSSIIVTNTATGKADSASSSASTSPALSYTVNGSTLLHKMNLTAGTYTIKVVNVPYYHTYILPSNYYPSCYWDTVITLTSGGPLQNPAMLATSSCNGGTSSTVALSVTGGSGPGTYTYQLQSTTNGGSTWNNEGEAQPTGIFSGLDKSTQYRVVVVDTCGNSVNFQVSFNSTPIKLTYSSVAQPCTNDAFTMTLPIIDGAKYSWTANDAIIPGATGNSYTVTVPDNGVVTYVGQISIGDCIIMSQPYTLDPGNCAKPFITPITGFRLSAQVQANKDVTLNWSTAMEINSKNFAVQRSADGGKTWTTIATVATKAVNGNSSTPLSYTLTDANVQPGSYEYQVVETDIDGNQTTSNIVQIQVTGSGANVYPIPASTYLRIVLPVGVNNAPYRMISADGKVVLSGTMSNQGNFGQISVAGLASAVYFLQVTINNTVQTYKVQVQH